MPHFTIDEIAKMADDGFKQEYYDKVKDTAEDILGQYKNQIRKKENKQIDKKLAKELSYKIASGYAKLLKEEKHLDFKGDFKDEDSFKSLSLEDRARILDALRNHFGFDIDALKGSLEGKKISDHLQFISEYANQLVDFSKKSHHQKTAGYLKEHLQSDRDKTIRGVNKHLGKDYEIDSKEKNTIDESEMYNILQAGKSGNLTPKLVRDQFKYKVKYTGT